MKNLNVIRIRRAKLDANIVGQCIDADNKRFFLLTEDIKVFEVQSDKGSAQPVKLSSDGENPMGVTFLRRDEVVLIDYIVESGSICVALQDGRIVSIGVSSFSPPSRCVYTHNKEICSVKLSPGQDLIALSDKANDVFILATDFSVKHSDNALTQTNSAFRPVGVGWGSKETQFFGLDGRPSKEKENKEQVVVDQQELAAVERIESDQTFLDFRQRNAKNTIIDWRGDGQLLATFTLIPDSDKHYLKVWNRNLELQYMSEQLVTMEQGLLSWIPNGQYVCAAQRRNNRINEIALFEKNGMVHQRITLPTFMPHLYIKDLLWSPDSAILAIVGTKFELDTAELRKRQMILLYTMQNFQYYLKYSAYLPLEGDNNSMRWDPNHNNILYITSDNGTCLEYNCITCVDRCEGDSTVAVVDGSKILMTPFSKCNIPPPMSAMTIELDNLINRIIIPSTTFEYLVVINVDNELIYSSLNTACEHDKTTKVVTKIDSDAIKQVSSRLGKFRRIKFDRSYEYQNFMSIGHDCFIATNRVEEGTELVRVQINDSESNPSLQIHLLKLLSGRDVISVIKDSYDVASGSLSLLLDDLRCIRIDLNSGDVEECFTPTSNVDRFYVKETQYIREFQTTLILTLDLNLLVDGNLLASNCCTSFRVTPNFIVYTTIDNMIHFVPLDRLSQAKNSNEIGSWNQPIENGGTLVIASEDDSKVILQMPRGNIEILHPRIMVLLRLTNLIDRAHFVDAMKLARRYRVDLNFLIDYLYHSNADAFTKKTLSKIANDIADSNPTLLNLFITELSPEDTTTGRYQNAMNYLPQKNALKGHNEKPLATPAINTMIRDKVNTICSNIELPPNERYLQSRILCLLKQEPRKSAEALRLVHNLATKEEREVALKFMVYFINIEQLFLDAIATYDTDIALMVAGASSKDPKEYLALLDAFNEIENAFLRRFKMDYHIKNYESAFVNLLAYLPDAPDKDSVKSDLLNLVVDKRIYKSAIRSCFDQFVNFVSLAGQCSVDRTFEDLSMEIWARYADYLLEKRYYLEAGLAYSKSLARQPDDKKVENAVKCFLLTNDWQMAVATMERYNLTESKKNDLTRNIVHNLMLQGSFVESILVLERPKNDALAFEMIASGCWYLAELIVTEDSRSRLREEISKAVCVELSSLHSHLLQLTSKVTEQYDRILELFRTPRVADQLDADNCYTADSLSTVDGSEMSSILSGGNVRVRATRSGAPSIKTRASTKSNKSQAAKRKKISLKIGSRHEDLALALELKKFIESQKSTQKTIVDLIVAQIDYMDLHCLNNKHIEIIDLAKKNHDLANRILHSLWPKKDQEDNSSSVYRRFGRSLAMADCIDNEDLVVLTRPEMPKSCLVLEL